MKRFFVFLGVVIMTIGSAVRAQEVDSIAPLQKSSWGDAKTSETVDYIPDVYLDTRAGYNHFFTDGGGRFGATGLYLDINGNISPRLSYSFNHIIAADYLDATGFDATQWLNFTYAVGDFDFTVGKLSTNMGNFEYDADVLDAYFEMNSMVYNMLDCYQWGVASSWYPAEGHSIIFQFTNSPLATGDDQFAYNLAWRAEWDWYEPYWTVNLWQFEKSRYMKGLNLGNRFHFGNFSVDLEYMARAADMSGIFSDDFNIIAAPSYTFGEWGRIFGKFGFERTSADLPYDLAYEEYKGSDYIYYGAGMEFFPFKEQRDVRIHAYWASNNFGEDMFSIGLRWKLDLTSAAKKILGRIER
jgi:hypothetical protein